jgi:hypothetical protein
MLDGTEFFECRCGSDEHTLRFILDVDDNCFYTTVYLNSYKTWYRRLWVALKYLFGYKCKYGHWDCWILSADDVPRIIAMLHKLV